MRLVARHIVPLALALALPWTASASASALCERLERELTNLPVTITNTSDTREFTGAISTRSLELRKARNERRRMGCGGGSVIIIGGPNEAACEEISDEIALMQHNLEKLKSNRRSAVSGGDAGGDRRRIMAALEVNGCAEEREERMAAAAREPQSHRNIIGDLPPIGEATLSLRGGAGMTEFTLPSANPDGVLRTVCVRTCDGAFFPISSQASPGDFPRDIAACEARCPGASTELYYHALATEETDDMVSAVTGKPYAEMPKAFAFRTLERSKAGQCGCALPGGLALKTDAKDGTNGKSVIDVTTATSALQQSKPARVIEERPYDPKSNHVRIVGPTFLPAEESKIDLKNPAGPGFQPTQDN